MNLVSFGIQVKEARKQKDLTQSQLAELLGVGNNYISLLERGAKAPSIATLVGLCNALDVGADRLLMGYTHAGVNMHSSLIQDQLDQLDISQKQTVLDLFDSIIQSVSKM